MRVWFEALLYALIIWALKPPITALISGPIKLPYQEGYTTALSTALLCGPRSLALQGALSGLPGPRVPHSSREIDKNFTYQS